MALKFALLCGSAAAFSAPLHLLDGRLLVSFGEAAALHGSAVLRWVVPELTTTLRALPPAPPGAAWSVHFELSPAWLPSGEACNRTLLAPGATATALYDPFERVDVARGRRWGVMMSPEGVAREGLRALFAGRAVVVPGALAKLMCCCMALTPQWALDCVRGCVPWLPRPGR